MRVKQVVSSHFSDQASSMQVFTGNYAQSWCLWRYTRNTYRSLQQAGELEHLSNSVLGIFQPEPSQRQQAFNGLHHAMLLKSSTVHPQSMRQSFHCPVITMFSIKSFFFFCFDLEPAGVLRLLFVCLFVCLFFILRIKKWVYILSCSRLCSAELQSWDFDCQVKCTLISLSSYLLTSDWRGHVVDFMNIKRVEENLMRHEENNPSLVSAEFIQRLNCKHIHKSPLVPAPAY